jgi:hypothetical protein
MGLANGGSILFGPLKNLHRMQTSSCACVLVKEIKKIEMKNVLCSSRCERASGRRQHCFRLMSIICTGCTNDLVNPPRQSQEQDMQRVFILLIWEGKGEAHTHFEEYQLTKSADSVDVQQKVCSNFGMFLSVRPPWSRNTRSVSLWSSSRFVKTEVMDLSQSMHVP